MELARPHPDCPIVNEGPYVKAIVGPGEATDVMECYRTLVVTAITHKVTKVLVVGLAAGDPMWHLAARDAVAALHEVGVPAGFKLAFVPQNDYTWNGYRHAQIEAEKRGLRVKVFHQESEAASWLTEPEKH
jgi:hypothetical protein